MPITSKQIVVTLSAAADKGIIRLQNIRTGDIWSGIISTDTTIIDLANNNIWGAEPTQWVIGDVLEIVLFAVNAGGTTYTIVDGMNEATITTASDTAVELAF